MFRTPVISTSGPRISCYLFKFSLFEEHQPVTYDCSVAAYVTHHPCSFREIRRQTDEKDEAKKDNCGEWKAVLRLMIWHFIGPAQLLVFDNWSEATNNVWRGDYVETVFFCSPKGCRFGFLFRVCLRSAAAQIIIMLGYLVCLSFTQAFLGIDVCERLILSRLHAG